VHFSRPEHFTVQQKSVKTPPDASDDADACNPKPVISNDMGTFPFEMGISLTNMMTWALPQSINGCIWYTLIFSITLV
jgi:hypothetical protein